MIRSVVLALTLSISLAQATLTAKSLKVLHSLDSEEFGLRYDFKKEIIPASRYGITKSQKTLSKTDGGHIYRIALALPNGRMLQTWVDYKALEASCFHDSIEIFLNKDGTDVLAFGYHPEKPAASPCTTTTYFKTTVKVLSYATSPGADTDRWIEQQKKEQEKKKAEAGQPQSFFGKYWMYIAGAFLLMNFLGGAG